MKASVAVVVVAYNDAQTLERCVRTLHTAVEAPIVIVDNHSDDDTWSIASGIAADIPTVAAIRSDRNEGYAAGVSLARETIQVEFLAVSNADCTTTGDWVSPLVEFLRRHPDTAAASPTLALADGSTLNAEGLDIHTTGFGFNRHLGRPLEMASTQHRSVPGIQGTAFVVSSVALDSIGGWYTGGFLYHEDVELSWALRLAGYDISYVPTPPILHDYRLTMSPEKFFLLERNRLCMLATDLRTTTKLVMFPAILATEIAVWAYAIRKGTGFASAKLRSYRSAAARRDERRTRRRAVRSFRTISDRELLRSMSWRYPRTQTRTLHRGVASSGRRGDREMPTL
ncbi:MAG: glycosyltransferase [Actinomycetia bacterium]|nr:glycosyltransferase [Actinomycetes bacterium]